MTKKEDIRRLVVDTLVQAERQEGGSHIVIRNVLDKYAYLDKRDRAFFTRVVQGTIQYRLRIDYMLDQCAKVQVRRQKPAVRAILRSAVYQLEYMDSVPDRAVCSEAVRLAGAKGLSNLKGFVNGVLRGFLRCRPRMAFPDRDKDPAEALSVEYSMPRWIVEQWMDQWGAGTAERMLEASLVRGPVTAACNMLKCSRGQCLERLWAEGAKAEPHGTIPFAMVLEEIDALPRMASFQDGWFQVQDTGSMLAVLAADIQPGDSVLDVCAAPGGKALLAAMFAGKGSVTGRDISEAKLPVMEENRMRMGHMPDGSNVMDHVSFSCRDAAVPDEALAGTKDVVLADVPCSGLGVVHKKTDLKYHVTADQQRELAGLQRRILEAAALAVRPGGVLVYSTCTVNRQENEDNFLWFLKRHPEFEPVNLTERLPLDEGKHSHMKEGRVQLLPGQDPTDGFFIGCARRTATNG